MGSNLRMSQNWGVHCEFSLQHNCKLETLQKCVNIYSIFKLHDGAFLYFQLVVKVF